MALLPGQMACRQVPKPRGVTGRGLPSMGPVLQVSPQSREAVMGCVRLPQEQELQKRKGICDLKQVIFSWDGYPTLTSRGTSGQLAHALWLLSCGMGLATAPIL